MQILLMVLKCISSKTSKKKELSINWEFFCYIKNQSKLFTWALIIYILTVIFVMLFALTIYDSAGKDDIQWSKNFVKNFYKK